MTLRRKKILIVRLDHTGDCVMTVPPVVRALQEIENAPQVDLIASRTNCSLLEKVEGIRERLIWDAPWSVPPFGSRSTPRMQYFSRVFRLYLQYPKLVMRAYDATLFLSFNPWEKFLLRFSSSKRIGFRGPYVEERHTKAERYLTDLVAFDESVHLLKNCETLVRSWEPKLPALEAASIPVVESWSEGKWSSLPNREALNSNSIVVHPGHPSSFKSWPPGRFVELINSLAEKGWGHIWITASQFELNLQQKLIEATKHPNVSVLSCDSLSEFAGIVKRVGVVVANDGGPAHISAAMGVPTVVVFGPTDERLYAPLGGNVRCIRGTEVDVAPCQTPWRKAASCCQQSACLTQLESKDALKAIEELKRNRV